VEKPSLRKLREYALKEGKLWQTWSNNFVPAFLCEVGDVGYIAAPSTAEESDAEEGVEDETREKDEKDEKSKQDENDDKGKPKVLEAWAGFERFVRLCNVFDMDITDFAEYLTDEERQNLEEVIDALEVEDVAEGWTTSFEPGQLFQREEVKAFEAGDGVMGCVVPILRPSTGQLILRLYLNWAVASWMR
jgi:hypothetical protein